MPCVNASKAVSTATADNLQEDRWTYRFNLFDTARALENQVFWVAANQSGTFGSLRYVGNAKIVDPGGNILDTTLLGSGLAVAEVDIAESFTAMRAGMFHLRDRRPEVYGMLVEADTDLAILNAEVDALRFGAAPDVLAAPATTGSGDGATVADPGDGNGRTRGGGPLALVLVVGLLAALVVGGVLLAQNLRGGPAPQAAAASSESESASSESASDTPSPSESTSPSPTPTSESAAAAPQPVQALRSVPDLPEHEAEHDADLSNLIDGDPTTVWRTFAYARPNFGGYVESMNLVVQLEERTEVNEVTLQSTGATGGAWFAYIADSPEGANAQEIGNGTFDQDTVSIPVPFEGTEAEAEYVIVSLTSLPQLEGTTSDLPFGLRLGEIAVR